MEISQENRGGLTVVTLNGKLDTVSSPEVQAAVMAALESADKGVVIDMAEVAYVSSAGLRVMLIGGKTAKAKAKTFRIAGLKPAVAEVFKMSGFDRLLEIHPDVAAAVG
ncbi:anti-sigma B factor antagonist [Tistlia consotensis]|uniref:Anti-sigma factor antagonist n=1 Tax=Tistlia consotensis USBA 355 TaxID=560819 RepID=A0A1Y6CUZ1_9PROT|nr:STAS domain-containing protein [Tistlia consotensis]SMF81218.1 anti-sigma B factor antagonist [Tistlia consotensis USBA 355]SNS23308.1 anti-sigma B factor antagonist [Tistlia consotensis]